MEGMVSSSQIKEHVALYLANQTDLGQFEDWFVPNTRDVRRTRSEEAMSLTFGVEAALSEYLSRIINEAELRQELIALIHRSTCEFTHYDAPIPIFANKPELPIRIATSPALPVFARS